LDLNGSAPLIYTKNGNVAEDTLDFSFNWEDEGNVLWLKLAWHDKGTGELMKNCAYGYVKQGLSMGGQQAQIM
jgi:hypothetical protein